MVKNHGKKQRARKKTQRTGASYASAAAGTTHNHAVLDTGLLEGLLPYMAGSAPDHDLAARLIGACWAGCRPCQTSLSTKAVAHRATLAGLAGGAYMNPLGAAAQASPLLAPPTRAWIARAQDAAASGNGHVALRAVDDLNEDDAHALLDDALDNWAALDMDNISLLKEVRAASEGASRVPPRQRPADPMDAFRAAGINVVTLDDLDLGDGIDPYHLAPSYGVFPGQTSTPTGRELPMLTLYPETDGAGIEDMESRTNWEHWGMYGLPDVDPLWRVRARIADRSLQGLVHVGPDGTDDVELWRAAESVSMPPDWWDLLDRAQHILIVGPVNDATPAALNAAGVAGRLLAVVARVAFV
ncbi:hypothetical protein [Streptomyces poriferorum]|uniref:Uncharacterized protein n=1 Tax=Streptomyces poriferorum TaxID=2798799 RepID=A0ABY9J4A3_9ACTN|nr:MULTISPECIES: hypothetical protein [unclassified Streptomyces]MDP5317414.1 hypothetical protein [Streptomyces sp. Alt4]WLQ62020.1 hypothetical protein P8A19_41845 [Streptomyces sp. Alt2]